MVGSDGHAAAAKDENEVADDLDAQSQGSDASSEDANAVSVADQQEDGPMLYASDVAARGTPVTPKKMLNICMVEEGRICLEKAQLIEPEDMLDSNVLAGALVQISLFLGLSQVARDAMRAVALLMVQPKQAGVEDAAAENIVDQVVDRLAEVVKTTTQAAVAEIKSASSALAESLASTQMAATATSYQDALTSKGSSLNPIAAVATLDVRVRAREGVKSQQI